jgi:hypothetical protein
MGKVVRSRQLALVPLLVAVLVTLAIAAAPISSSAAPGLPLLLAALAALVIASAAIAPAATPAMAFASSPPNRASAPSAVRPKTRVRAFGLGLEHRVDGDRALRRELVSENPVVLRRTASGSPHGSGGGPTSLPGPHIGAAYGLDVHDDGPSMLEEFYDWLSGGMGLWDPEDEESYQRTIAKRDPGLERLRRSGNGPIFELENQITAQTPGASSALWLAWAGGMSIPKPAVTVTSGGVGAGEGAATGFRGSRGAPLTNAPYQPAQNAATTVGGRYYSGHALDQMRNRGIMPSVVEDTVANGVPATGRGGVVIFATDQLRVVLNSDGGVITVIPR